MKRKTIMPLLALAVSLSLTACGGGAGDTTGTDVTADTTAPADTAEKPVDTAASGSGSEEVFVEEEPAKNELDASAPIPGVNREYELTEQVFEEENLIIRLPEGVTAVNEGRGDNLGHITLTDEADGWKLMFRPTNFGLENMVNNVSGSVIYDGNYIKTDWSQDVPATVAGFPAQVWANNIREGWLHPSNESDAPAVDIIVDYGETLVGEWLGMQIRLEALDPKDDTNIYHYLYNSKLRSVLNNFECIETPDGKEVAANGLAANFPARWQVKAGDSSMVALLHSREVKGGITLCTLTGADPAYHIGQYEGEQFDKSYGDNNWKGIIAEREFETGGKNDRKVIYSMYLFSEFNEKLAACVQVSVNDWKPEDYSAYLDNEQFVNFMNSVKLDPSAWHQPGTSEINGLLSDRGIISSYSGSDAEVEIPAVIGEYNTVYIGDGAFADNTDIKKVVIPEGVTEIRGNAFSGCTNLETVVFPETLNYIYMNAFRDCPALKDVVLPPNVSYVGWAAFQGSGTGTFTGSSAEYDGHAFDESSFEKISFADGSILSADNIFDGALVSEVEFPSDLTELGKSAFVNCHNIERIELPQTVRKIGEGAFSSMFGLPYVSLPEGLEEIPENCFNSTTLDVLVIPSTVTKIGDYATYGAACIIIQNPDVKIGERAIQADYVFLKDAKKHKFPSDHQEMEGSCLYLDGVYDPDKDIKGDFYNATAFSSQVFLPSDASYDESDALDRFLSSVGFEEIAWIGASQDFLPDSTYDFDYDPATYMLTGYHGDSEKLTVPQYCLYRDDDWWLTQNVYGIADGAFKDSTFTSAYFRCNLGDGVGSKILEGNKVLKDIWFCTPIVDEINAVNDYGKDYFQADTFEGIPENVTVHLPDSIAEDLRSGLEDSLRAHGIPKGATFEYYSYRD